jgi:competence protein CoiA
MNIALVNGQRQKAQLGLRGTCPECEQPVIAKCGEIRVWHWAHKVSSHCDSRWANEGPWHRDWKNEFPAEWQEFRHVDAKTGERHWADVQTEHGWVLEFQHSPIDPEERRSRDAFYPKLVWVVDGTTRKRDEARFLKAWEEGTPVGAKSPVRRVATDGCARLEEWAGSPAHVFFDFGDEQVLWWLLPKKSPNGQVYVAQFPTRAEFIELHRRRATEMDRRFDWLARDLIGFVEKCESYLRAQASNPFPLQPLPRLKGRPRIERVERYQARRRRRL